MENGLPLNRQFSGLFLQGPSRKTQPPTPLHKASLQKLGTALPAPFRDEEQVSMIDLQAVLCCGLVAASVSTDWEAGLSKDRELQ